MTDSVRPTIFITGGGSGIGRAVARHFAARGWFVGLADINEAGMAETQALLPHGMSSAHLLDVRHRDQWQRALSEFAAVAGGRMDVLFNNAGVGLGGTYETLSPDDADFVIDVNFRGVMNGIYTCLPLLRAAAPGSCILNTGSASGYYGSPGLSIYSATKFAVRALTEALDIEFEAEGIKVRDIMPGFIDTPLLNRVVHNSNETSRDRVIASGLEFTPVETVAQAAWDAVHGDTVHTAVGKTARRLAFASRWMPGRLRKTMKKSQTSGRVSLGN
ncbi:MAG: SDR family oxidoreductase [Sphingopyxis sp.]|nr:SDR family oxidoreductase [Sphingopyxis sp.]